MITDEIVISGKRAMARSYAKINLTLDVLQKRSDGYHDVEMIMQSVSLYDLIIVDKSNTISVKTNLHYLPNNDKNIAYKAADLFFRYTNIDGGCKILIHKNIPVAAGLAGGSGNAAAVLCALDKLYNTNLSIDELKAIAANLGADVPYCIMGGTALSTGIGEILTPLPDIPKCSILLVKPPISISTRDIYEKIDSANIADRPDTREIIDAINTHDIRRISNNLSNVMESVAGEMYPIIGGIKKKMLLNGAVGACMSGSGPTVFGIFTDYEAAKKSHDSFCYQFKEVYLTSPK